MECAKCRLCLGTLGDSRRCLWDCSFQSVIGHVFWFKITPSDGLPAYACRQCCSFVRKFHKYGLKVQKNQTKLLEELLGTHLLREERSGSYESTGELEEALRLSSSDDEGQKETDSFSSRNQTTADDTLIEESERHEVHEDDSWKTLEIPVESNGSKSSLADNECLDKTYQQEAESDLNSCEVASVEESAPKRKYLTRSVQQAKRTKQFRQSVPATDGKVNVKEKFPNSEHEDTSEMEISVQEDKYLVHAVKDQAPTGIDDGVLRDINLVNVKLQSGDLVSGAVAGIDTTSNSDSTEKALCGTVPLPADVGKHNSRQISRLHNDMHSKAKCMAKFVTVQIDSTGKRSKAKGKTKKKKREKICTSFADIWREFSKYCTGALLTKDDIDRCNMLACTSKRNSRRGSCKKSPRKGTETTVRTDNESRHVSGETSKQSVEQSSDEDNRMRVSVSRKTFQESFEEFAYSDSSIYASPGCQVQDSGNVFGRITPGELNKVLHKNSNESQDSESSTNKENVGDAIEAPIDVESYDAVVPLGGSVTTKRNASKHEPKKSSTKTKATKRSKNSSSLRDVFKEFAFPYANTVDDGAGKAYVTNTSDSNVENGSIRRGSI